MIESEYYNSKTLLKVIDLVNDNSIILFLSSEVKSLPISLPRDRIKYVVLSMIKPPDHTLVNFKSNYEIICELRLYLQTLNWLKNIKMKGKLHNTVLHCLKER